MADLWRHRWQVVRLFHNGAVIVNCSHRWEWTAYGHASLRQLLNRDTRLSVYDLRRTPDRAAAMKGNA
jgi:hypothetical protein